MARVDSDQGISTLTRKVQLDVMLLLVCFQWLLWIIASLTTVCVLRHGKNDFQKKHG